MAPEVGEGELTMPEYGIFNDEGCIANEFYSREKAEAWAREHLSDDDDAKVHEVCPDHREETRDACSICNAD